MLRGPQWAVLGEIGWYLGVIRKGDREPGRGRSTKGIQFVGSTKGVIKEVEIKKLHSLICFLKKKKGSVGLWGRRRLDKSGRG